MSSFSTSTTLSWDHDPPRTQQSVLVRSQGHRSGASTSSLCVTCYDISPSSSFCTPECKSLSKAFSRRLESVIDTDHDTEILEIPEEESQSAVNLLQNALVHSPHFKPHRRRIRRLLVKLSVKHNILPASLFLRGVKYNGGECHSSGSFADIYLGEHNGRTVALKRLRMFQMIDEARSTQLKRAFHHESLIWLGLDHQHVLPFLGVDDTVFKRNPCMVLPWMGLGNIRHASLSLRRSLSVSSMVAQTLTWIHEITMGLAYLHNEGIVHGDLRGPNILVDIDRTVKLADFGLAVFAEGASRNYGSTRGGNARWLAPELIYPEHFGLTSDRPTRTGDVFALGCVCVELFTCKAPYANVSDNQVIARVPHGLRPERPKFSDGTDVPDALWSTITLCWHAEPSHRPSTPALVEATRSLITTARPLTPPPDFLEPTEEKVTLDIVTAGEDPLLGIPPREDDDVAVATRGENATMVPYAIVAGRPLDLKGNGRVVMDAETQTELVEANDASPTGGRKRRRSTPTVDHTTTSIHRVPYPSPTLSQSPECPEGHEKRRKGLTTWNCPSAGCGQTFTRQFQLKRHLLSHSDEKPFTCSFPDCQKTFAKDQTRKWHEERQHPALITCEGCKRFFLTVDSMNRHHESAIGKKCKEYHHALAGLAKPAVEDDHYVP